VCKVEEVLTESFVVQHPQRIDRVLSGYFSEYSRTYFQRLIKRKLVTCNGRVVKKGDIPRVGDKIDLLFLRTQDIELKPQNIPLDILFEDEYLICINKPAGMVVHPAPGHTENTCVNALLNHCPLPSSRDLRPGIVHRLDRDTSGVLIVAKTLEAQHKLAKDFSMRLIRKEYLAVTSGHPKSSIVAAPIGRHPVKRKEMTILSGGRDAQTQVELLISRGEFSLVKMVPTTGRTHQIRVHLKYLNTPVLGDSTYGPKRLNCRLKIERQLLHAHRIIFSHPILGRDKWCNIVAPLPGDFRKWIGMLFNKRVM